MDAVPSLSDFEKDDPFKNPSWLLEQLNARAFSSLIVQRWMAHFTRLALSHLRFREPFLEIEDIVQEFWIRFLRLKMHFEDLRHVQAVSFTLLRRVGVDLAREAHALKRGGRMEVSLTEDLGLVEPSGSALDQVIENQKVDRLAVALEQMSEKDQELILNRLSGDKRLATGADRVALHRATRRARARLEKLLSKM